METALRVVIRVFSDLIEVSEERAGKVTARGAVPSHPQIFLSLLDNIANVYSAQSYTVHVFASNDTEETPIDKMRAFAQECVSDMEIERMMMAFDDDGGGNHKVH